MLMTMMVSMMRTVLRMTMVLNYDRVGQRLEWGSVWPSLHASNNKVVNKDAGATTNNATDWQTA